MKTTGLNIDLSSRKFQVLFLLTIVVSNLILKFSFIHQDQISFDEPWTLFFSQQPLPLLLDNLASDFHPPFYFILEHFSIKLFGDGVVGARIISLLFSSLTILPIFLIGKRINLNVGYYAVLFFFVSTIHMYFSHEARAYSLLCFLCSYSFYFLVKLLESNKPNIKDSIWFVIISCLLIYTHFFSLFLFLSQILIVLLFGRNKLKLFVILFLSILVLFIPYLPVFYNKFFVTNGMDFWLEGTPGLEGIYNNLWKFTNSPIMAIVSVLTVLGTLFFFIKNIKVKSGLVLKIVLLWLTITMMAMFLFSYKTNIYLERYLLFVTPALYILLANVSFICFKNKTLQNVIPIILIGVMSFSFKPETKNDLKPKEMANYVNSIKNDKTLVLILPVWTKLNFCYHYDIDKFREFKNFDANLRDDNIIITYGKLDEVFNLQNEYEKLILIEAGKYNKSTSKILKKKFELTDYKDEFNGFEVYTFNFH